MCVISEKTFNINTSDFQGTARSIYDSILKLKNRSKKNPISTDLEKYKEFLQKKLDTLDDSTLILLNINTNSNNLRDMKVHTSLTDEERTLLIQVIESGYGKNSYPSNKAKALLLFLYQILIKIKKKINFTFTGKLYNNKNIF